MQFRRFTLLNLHDTQKYAQNYYRMTISMISKIKLHDIVKKNKTLSVLLNTTFHILQPNQ